VLPNGAFQFTFTGDPTGSYTVLSTTNLLAPLADWPVAGPATNIGAGLFQFATPPLSNQPQQFFRVSSP